MGELRGIEAVRLGASNRYGIFAKSLLRQMVAQTPGFTLNRRNDRQATVRTRPSKTIVNEIRQRRANGRSAASAVRLGLPAIP